MLSRVADTLYWMSRFIERAEGVTRLVEVYRDSDLEVDARLGNVSYWQPTLLALCVFLLYYVVSMVGEQLVKSGTLEPWSGMWLSTLLLTPLAALLMWSTLKERRWLPQPGG